MARRNSAGMPEVLYSITKLGGGQTQTGVSFPGGLDLTTPSLSLQAGALVAASNYECSLAGGYGRIKGYERFDGRPMPSASIYQIIQVTAFVNLPVIGQTITQTTSGATGVIFAVNNVAGATYVAVTKVTGTFDTSHNISVSATLIGTAIPVTATITLQQNAIYLAAAADVYRADIGTVPGSGPILGVVAMVFSAQDFVYAFRANAGNTKVLLYVNSASGWTLVPFFNTLAFTAGTGPGGSGADYEPPDGTSITQGGVTATIKRVMWQSGSFVPGTATAAGVFVITNPTGGNFTSGSATLGDTTTVTLSGVQVPISLTPGGKYEFTKANFSGQPNTRRIYGCDGVNQCFEFDGTIYAPITTGLSPDSPSHITFHREFLFVSFGGSLIFCGAGTPFKWNSVDGGGEIAVGDTVTGMITLPGSQTTTTMAVFMVNNTGFLYGTDPTTFSLNLFNTGVGALPYSIQNLFDTFYFDMLGAVNLRTTLNWGNFLPTALNKNLLPLVQQERSKLIASTINRSKSQYRVFFSDGYGLYITFVNGQYLGAIPVQFTNPVNCIDEEKNSLGNEVTYFGSNDGLGYVYQLDAGTGFDGQILPAFITTAWDPQKSPRIIKRYRAASIEMQATGYVQISFGYRLNYGAMGIAQPANYSADFSPSFWDAFTWDNFTWDGQSLAPTDVDMTGAEVNVQFSIASSTNYIDAFNLNSIIAHYTPRRGKRV